MIKKKGVNRYVHVDACSDTKYYKNACNFFLYKNRAVSIFLVFGISSVIHRDIDPRRYQSYRKSPDYKLTN